MPAVGISLGRIVVLYLPLAVIGMMMLQATGIFGAYAVANIVSGIIAYEWAKRTVRRHGGQRT